MEMANFDPLQNRNHWADCKKTSAQLITSVSWPRYTKFGTNPSTGGFWANGWNITFYAFLVIYFNFFSGVFLRLAYRIIDRAGWWIFTRDSSKDVKSRKDVPLRFIKLKFNLKRTFLPKTLKFSHKRDCFPAFFGRKRVRIGVLKSKLPFIILAP